MITGDGPPVVLLHGLFGAARNLAGLSRGLSARFRVVAMDLRNHGESPRAAGMGFEVMAADVAETIARLGITQAMVAGHSLGGKTAMMLALMNPGLVARLAVLDIAPVSYNHGYDKYVQAMQAVVLSPDLTRAKADEILAPVVRDAAMRAFLLNNLVLGPNMRWRVGLDEIGAAMPDLLAWRDPPAVSPYRGPTLFLAGGLSDYVTPYADAAISRLFADVRRVTVEGASHWLHAEKPGEVVASLEGFFSA
ncbi:MAG: alpha/beta fold hydrolase [Acidocella sp.]|nr:alpha/beta fold hydrolase [Acidocella sp.]